MCNVRSKKCTWLILQEASAVIAFLRGLNKDDEDVIKEINNLQREDQYIKSMPSLSLLSIRMYPILIIS